VCDGALSNRATLRKPVFITRPSLLVFELCVVLPCPHLILNWCRLSSSACQREGTEPLISRSGASRHPSGFERRPRFSRPCCARHLEMRGFMHGSNVITECVPLPILMGRGQVRGKTINQSNASAWNKDWRFCLTVPHGGALAPHLASPRKRGEESALCFHAISTRFSTPSWRGAEPQDIHRDSGAVLVQRTGLQAAVVALKSQEAADDSRFGTGNT
jgi:hypothetical protein